MNYEPDSEAVTAAIADVEPLDEITKARLVNAAMAATAPRRSSRWLGVAAACVAVALVAGGTVALVTRDDADRKVAQPSVASTDTSERAGRAEAVSGPRDLGSVKSSAELRDALNGSASTDSARAADASDASGFAPVPAGVAASCPGPNPFPPPATEWATLIYRGDPALVAVAIEDDVQYAYVLSPDGCTLLSRVEL